MQNRMAKVVLDRMVEFQDVDSASEPTTPLACVPAPSEDKSQSSGWDTTFVFDWDDTLLSSSWISKNQMRLTPDKHVPEFAAKELKHLQEAVIELITVAASLGRCVIITNAEQGWVELSCGQFMPDVLEVLKKLGFRVLSARSVFEEKHPNSPLDWKVEAFRHELRALYNDTPKGVKKNILSLGDSVYERTALFASQEVLGDDVCIKNIKFIERPSIEALVRQVQIVAQNLELVTRSDAPLDLMLTHQFLD